MSHPLENLEYAEELVIKIMENIGLSLKELKDIQTMDSDKKDSFQNYAEQVFGDLRKLQDIMTEEMNNVSTNKSRIVRRPGTDLLAITNWEAKTIADELHDLQG